MARPVRRRAAAVEVQPGASYVEFLKMRLSGKLEPVYLDESADELRRRLNKLLEGRG